MSRRSLLVGVLAWLAVVVVTSVITWTVIDAAGQQVLTTSDLPAQARPRRAGHPRRRADRVHGSPGVAEPARARRHDRRPCLA